MILESEQMPELPAPAPVRSSDLLAVSYGGGTNSTAMLCGFKERGIKPDAIYFADTGAEMPHTMKHVEVMAGKVNEWWGIELKVVRHLYQGKFEGIAGECERNAGLPALAYGMRACSVKYKTAPADRYLKAWLKTKGQERLKKAVGFSAEESHRVKAAYEPWYDNWYPLIEWQWYREECVDAICRHGLPQPGKSACFFCPAMKRSEVIKMKKEHPDLMNRALAIEDAAQKTVTTKRGLGGQGNLWRNWLAMDDAQAKLMLDIEPHETPCGCIDG